MRAMLFVAADDETMLAKALEAGADGVCLDMQSSVPPAAKFAARKIVSAWVAAAKATALRPLIYVRINGLETDFIDSDLEAILPAGPDGILLPNCVNGQSLQHLGAKLAVKEAECGLADGVTRIIAGVAETATSIFNMGTFAGASRRLKGLVWSSETLAAALAATPNHGRDASLAPYMLARSLTLFAARAANVLAIDQISSNSGDSDAFRRDCEAARRDGFDGKMAIDRTQVEIINAVFAPSA